MKKHAQYVESPSSVGQLRECSTMVGRWKSTELARMEHAMQTLYFIRQHAASHGVWATNDLSLIPFQRKAEQALEELASELWVKLVEARGQEKADRALTHILCRRKSGGKQQKPLDRQTE
jgi:hypothetical protein